MNQLLNLFGQLGHSEKICLVVIPGCVLNDIKCNRTAHDFVVVFFFLIQLTIDIF